MTDRKIKEYKLVFESTSRDFTETINEYLSRGFELRGPIIDYPDHWAQEMVKYDK